MNPRKVLLLIVLTTSASIALTDDFKTVNGKEYKNVTVTRVQPNGLVLRTKWGIVKLYFVELPKDVQEQAVETFSLNIGEDTLRWWLWNRGDLSQTKPP